MAVIWARLVRPRPDRTAARVRFVGWTVAALYCVLVVRLFWMQILDGARYRDLARLNSVRTIPIRAPRGLILDRHLRVLVDNAPAVSVGITPAELPRDPAQAQAVVESLAGFLNLPLPAVEAKVASQRVRPYAPARLAVDVDPGLVARLEERTASLPGMTIWQDSKRSYPVAEAAHVLGYVGEITQGQLERLKDRGYRLGDWLGQTGLESYYDEKLRGVDGGKEVRIDAGGHELGILREVPPQPGQNLVLTIDAGLQAVAEDAMGQDAGAIVALDPRNGEILAMVSKPDYPASAFAGRVDAKVWDALNHDERHPMDNRAVQGLYPPGSVFKIVTALAALQEGAITPETHFTCNGIFWISTWPYRCWKEIGHGSIALEQAIIESCDIFFYQVGLKLKVDALARWTRNFGFGTKTGIDLPDEQAGVVPDPAWKQLKEGLPWFPGNTVMMAIGQGYMQATILQLARATAAVANGGFLVHPHLLKSVTSSEGDQVETEPVAKSVDLGLNPDYVSLVQRGMEGAVESPRGTASRARVDGLSVAGKTGTAQNSQGEDHAVFVCFAPVESPQVAIAIIVEHGGEGGLSAAPIAKRMLEYLYKDGQ
ncbi:MAG TPA: penicillin-binding protein 2 [bacterium]|nr:penicillin-binding protein 2 [bacterium]